MIKALKQFFRTSLCRAVLVPISLVGLSACAAESPDVLVKRLQSALDQADADGALALGDFAQAPPMVISTYMGILESCAYVNYCKVTLGEFNAEQEQAGLAKRGLHYTIAPIGELKIAMTWRKDGANGGKASLPYALVGKAHRIVYASYTPAELARLRAKTTQQLLDDALQQGIADLSLSENRSDWRTAAKPLAADGGEIGKQFQTRAQAIYEAANKLDLAGLLSAGGLEEARNYYAFDASGKPLPAKVMALRLRQNLPNYPSSVKVLGGLERNDVDGKQVLLLIEAILPNGWIERGPVLINIYPETSASDWRFFNLTVTHPR
jgi:hypothetical protein